MRNKSLSKGKRWVAPDDELLVGKTPTPLPCILPRARHVLAEELRLRRRGHTEKHVASVPERTPAASDRRHERGGVPISSECGERA